MATQTTQAHPKVATQPPARSRPAMMKALFLSNGLPIESTYLRLFKASPSERIGLIRKGIPAEMLVMTGADMGVPKERLLALLQFPRTTVNRRILKEESLPSELSERMIGLQMLIGQVESIMAESGAESESGEGFNAARWVAQWLEHPLPALANAKPADYMDTGEGQKLVSGLLAKMQSGAYA